MLGVEIRQTHPVIEPEGDTVARMWMFGAQSCSTGNFVFFFPEIYRETTKAVEEY